ncbi:hypothetical protein [Halorhabdus amylolytica]|uniref:hypothetical protein n=1 Tax=Halorhabdus amylolytica TaxID=2559573 RepID=UPI0010AA3E1A|nr:hypothetical protein [Halorhabdus amylolytica]
MSVDRSPETFKSVAGDGGHNWTKIGRLRLDDGLPPREWVFQRAKCLQHASMQVDSIPTPSMAALEVDDPWYDERIEQPTVHREHDVGVKPADTFREGHAEQFKTAHSTLDYEALPGQIKQAIVEERDLGWVSEDEFYRLMSDLEGHEIGDVDALPDCERSYVVCNDDRGVKCNGSKADFGGNIGRYFWYHTTYQGRSFVVVPGQVEKWLESDASTPEPCTGSREELFQVTIYGKEERYRGLESATVGADVPEYLAEWARSDPSSYSHRSASESRWVRLIQILESDESIRLPQCQWENVRCVRNGNERCGSGHREAFYVLEVDGESWWFNFEYKWSGS